MVMFFVRTQHNNTWQTPPYRFNNRQKNAFQRLIAAARQEVARRESDSNSGSNEDGSSKEDIETDSEARTKNKGK
jgi:hypothetical protein